MQASQAVLQALTLSLLLGSPVVLASDPIVRIFNVGQGFVVPPEEPSTIRYLVSPAVEGNHYIYVDDVLVLVRDADQMLRSAAGVSELDYPIDLALDRLMDLRICVDTAAAEVCDQVSIRAGQVQTPGQTVEIRPAGVAGYFPPRTPVNIHYSILKPTVADQLFFVDEQLRSRRKASSPQFGPQSIGYAGGIKNGEKRFLRFCLDQDPAGATCGFAEVTGGQPPNGVDLPEPFLAADLQDHFQALADCSPVCGYYANIYYGDPGVSWLPDRGDGLPDGLRMDLYYSHANAQINPEAPPSTLIFYAHSAGSNKESLLTNNQSLLKRLLGIADAGAGVVVASLDFRHPIKQLEADLTPTSVNDLSYAIQFARHHAAELNINPDDIFIVGASLGAGVAVHAAVRDIANPGDASPVRQHSSSIRGVITRDAQTSFAPHWFRSHFLEEDVAARYQRHLLDDEQRLIYGHAPAGVSSNAPYMELLYTSAFIGHKVTMPEYLARSVDLVHLPNYGLAMEQQYHLHGIAERIRVRERYRGNFGRDAAHFVAQHRLGRD